jgi:hypothetical protein
MSGKDCIEQKGEIGWPKNGKHDEARVIQALGSSFR